MPQKIKTILDLMNEGKIINLPDGVDPQDAATVNQLGSPKVSSEAGNAVQQLPDGIYVPNTIMDGIVYGGIITWASNYTYEGNACGYYIKGVFYVAPARTVALGNAIVLSAPDATYNRIDVFYVDKDAAIKVLQGAPSSTPEKPSLATDQLELSFALVETGTTQPTLNQEQIYKENAGEPTEWTAATNASARINLASTSGPIEGTIDIEATDSVNADTITITNDSPLIITSLNSVLTFKIKPKTFTGKANTKKLTLSFRLSGALVGKSVALNNGSYGYDVSSQTIQTISIPLADFGLTNSDNVDNFFIQNISGGSYGFYLDDIKLQGVALVPLVSGASIPKGGTTGQVLTKRSNTDYDADWENISQNIDGGFAAETYLITQKYDGGGA